MGRARPIPRSRVPLHRRFAVDPGLARRWLLVAALATVTGSVTQHVVAGAASTRSRWGRTVPVVVTTRSRAPGDPLAGSVRTVEWPAALAPAQALARLPRGARAAGPLDLGVPLTPAAVAGGGRRTA